VSAETGIVGIGLGGPEHAYPPEPFAPVYRRAADLGLRRVSTPAKPQAPPAYASPSRMKRC
jgi:hypothetical protein